MSDPTRRLVHRPVSLPVSLLFYLTCLPRREVSGAVQKRHDKHPRVLDAVLEPIPIDEHLADGRVVEFWHHAPTLGQRRRLAPARSAASRTRPAAWCESCAMYPTTASRASRAA